MRTRENKIFYIYDTCSVFVDLLSVLGKFSGSVSCIWAHKPLRVNQSKFRIRNIPQLVFNNFNNLR